MNFNDIQQLENSFASFEKSESPHYQSEVLEDYLNSIQAKEGANENPFIGFYEDVIRTTMDFNFKPALGEAYYKNASDDASSCLNICDDFSRLSKWAIGGWLHSALKFVDNIVLHYIQDCCKEVPKSYPKSGVEKSRYRQLTEKKGEIAIAGAELIDLYDLRNDLEHRTRTYPDGKQELIPPNRSKVRKTVIKLYPETLRNILKTYKGIYPFE